MVVFTLHQAVARQAAQLVHSLVTALQLVDRSNGNGRERICSRLERLELHSGQKTKVGRLCFVTRLSHQFYNDGASIRLQSKMIVFS